MQYPLCAALGCLLVLAVSCASDDDDDDATIDRGTGATAPVAVGGTPAAGGSPALGGGATLGGTPPMTGGAAALGGAAPGVGGAQAPGCAVDLVGATGCGDCGQTFCCTAQTACASDPTCSALNDCITRAGCENPGVVLESCIEFSCPELAGAAPTWKEINICLALRCASAC